MSDDKGLDDKGLEVSGQLDRITTTKDGGWKVTFEFPGDSTTGLVMAALATMRDRNLKLSISEQP